MTIDVIVSLIFMVVILIPVIFVYVHGKKVHKKLHEVAASLSEVDVGTLIIATDGVDEPYMFLSLEIPSEELLKKKRVMLKVYIDDSQKKHTL